MQGILTRAVQSTGSEGLIATEIFALRYGARYYKIQDPLIKIREVASQAHGHGQAKARERKERDAVKALGKARQAMKKQAMWVYIPLDCILCPKLRLTNRTPVSIWLIYSPEYPDGAVRPTETRPYSWRQ